MHQGTQLIRDFTTIRVTPFLQFLRRQCPGRASQLMCFFVEPTKKYVIGLWANRIQGRVIELFNYKDEEDITQEDVQSILFNVNDGNRIKAIRAGVEQMHRDQYDQAQWWSDTHERRKDLRKYVSEKCATVMDPKDPRWLCVI